ncbi:MAG: FliA/WhiG family RNA polymerase sigma factor [Dehalococcoidia bacterium]|nr:FliA/WhiG family RNA polymerase sigma factor [Dehalococcoidia bacterium]
MNRNVSTLSSQERDRIIEEHLPLVRYVVRKMHVANAPVGLEFDDLVGHGTLGLIQAVDRFDGSQGVQFSSFAITRIRGAVLDALRALDPVGRPTRTLAKRLDATYNTLALELGREPSACEVQQAAGVAAPEYWRARAATSLTVVPIEHPSDSEHSWEDRLVDESATVSTGLEQRDMAECLSKAIADLPDRERLILSLYYVEGLTLKDIARALDISETRVSQLLHRCYARLRANPALVDAA